MARLVKKLAIGASLALGFSAAATVPALAGSLTNPIVTGTVETDYYLYDVRDTNGDGIVDQTYLNPSADLDSVLMEQDGTPGGNVELWANSEQSGADFFAPQVSLSGQIKGKTLTLSSLNAFDWFTTSSGTQDYTYNGDTLATRWFNELLTNAGQGGIVGKGIGEFAFDNFIRNGGFQRASDPNISYVKNSEGSIDIGLAGHFNMKDVYDYWFIPDGFQASEVVKYTYDGVTDYLFSFEATESGLRELADGKSHSGNYEVAIATVPEPSTLLGLMAVGSLFAAAKRKSKNA